MTAPISPRSGPADKCAIGGCGELCKITVLIGAEHVCPGHKAHTSEPLLNPGRGPYPGPSPYSKPPLTRADLERWRQELEQPPAAQAPDLVGEIIGFRTWRIRESVLEPIQLQSLTNRTPWPADDWLHAHCNGSRRCRNGTAVPGEECSCGIYAARSRKHLMDQWGYHDWPGRICIGEVGLAGRVIRGELAHRAQRARVVRLWVRHTDWKLVEPLSNTYCVPVGLTNLLTEGRRQ